MNKTNKTAKKKKLLPIVSILFENAAAYTYTSSRKEREKKQNGNEPYMCLVSKENIVIIVFITDESTEKKAQNGSG